jgi:hypothetical protein
MALVCAQCSRVNPAEASYCYHDGAALAGRAGGPVNAGSAPFPSPFVFPDGQACRNFDQLATACQQHWADAADLLKKGYLGTFFGNVGRLDLARAAQEAAAFPDADRGLDQLLAKLPSQALQAPKLQAEPSEINLGLLKVGEERATELHLSNLGMRLLYGTVASDCKWLALGEAPGSPQKLFQFGAETTLAVHVLGKHLRAGTKPLEGRLEVESNGGTSTIIIRTEVPIAPYQGGLFAGALTPRQVAEKAKANPKEAAPFFESGAVAAWYARNGWNYPVQGPTMSGMGGIQQFFEALGVAKPPKLELLTASLQLQGAPGEVVQTKIEVTTPERKPAYAWASCEQPWIEFGVTKLNGRSATVPVTIRIPAHGAPLLETKIQVVGNGNQKFAVPLQVNVVGAVPLMELEPAQLPGAPHDPFADLDALTPTPPPPLDAVALTPLDDGEGAAKIVPRPAGRKRMPLGPIPWLHLIPLAALLLALSGTVLHDILSPAAHGTANRGASGADDVDPHPHLEVLFDYQFGKERDKDVVNGEMMFGLAKLDPELGKVKDPPRLTFGRRGHTNSAVLMIDGKEKLFGARVSGSFTTPPKDIAGSHGGKFCTYQFNGPSIRVSQDVRVVPGEPVQLAPTLSRRFLDNCLVRYTLENHDKKPHKVGFRFLLDTYIADNDGVPFTLPGVKEMVSTMKDFKTPAEVPDFLQVLQRPDLKNHGLIMQLNLRVSDKLEPPEKLMITHYDQNARTHWKVPLKPMAGDSAVVMYWLEEVLAPGKKRELGFTYGLGDVTVSESALVGLTVGGSFTKNGDVSVVALVADPHAKNIKLELPPGLQLQGETPELQTVPAPEKTKEGMQPSPITWRVRALAAGEFIITVTTNPGAGHSVTQTRKIKIEAKPLF